MLSQNQAGLSDPDQLLLQDLSDRSAADCEVAGSSETASPCGDEFVHRIFARLLRPSLSLISIKYSAAGIGDGYVTGVIRASFPARSGGNAMRDGFPDTVAVGLGLAFAFALSLLVFVAFVGLH